MHSGRLDVPNGKTTHSEQKKCAQRPQEVLAGSIVCLAQWSGSAPR
jgi:hypothetical protein